VPEVAVASGAVIEHIDKRLARVIVERLAGLKPLDIYNE
jgi:hypothetical protein